ncbi:hypothetical protein ACFQJ7_01285 [Halovenus rubra]|uniref:Uncharacterized protein n=2 Tax=Halovenus rubra TaxID=869890 RepID=A0ACC7DZX1_9EURY|nr:hypothetical protein [Halovenus rubra]
MIDTLVLATVGVIVLVPSIAIVGGRTELLTHYPDSGGSQRVRYGAGGALVGYSLFTVATAFALVRTDQTGLLWAGWTVLTVVIGFGVSVFSVSQGA